MQILSEGRPFIKKKYLSKPRGLLKFCKIVKLRNETLCV